MPDVPLIALETLPCVLFDNRGALPQTSGVYLALAAADTVLYVGATRDLRRRWQQHTYLQELRNMACVRIAWYACDITALAATEYACLQQFQPLLNKRWPATSAGDTHWEHYAHMKRICLMITNNQHTQLTARAKDIGISCSELMRRIFDESLPSSTP